MSNGDTLQVTSEQVTNALCEAVGTTGKVALGISKVKIGTLSICSGLAMAMYLGKYPVYTIMLIGRWSSDTFLRYIHKQVMEFSHNVSRRMLNYQNYRHVPNIKHQILENNTQLRNDPNDAKKRRNLGGDTSRRVRLPAFSQFDKDLLGPIKGQAKAQLNHTLPASIKHKKSSKDNCKLGICLLTRIDGGSILDC